MLGTKMPKSSWNTTHHQVAGCIFLNYCSNHAEIFSVTTRVEQEQSNKFCLCIRQQKVQTHSMQKFSDKLLSIVVEHSYSPQFYPEMQNASEHEVQRSPGRSPRQMTGSTRLLQNRKNLVSLVLCIFQQGFLIDCQFQSSHGCTKIRSYQTLWDESFFQKLSLFLFRESQCMQ